MQLTANLTIILASLAVLIFMAIQYAGLPIVHMSWTTNQCIEVWSPDDQYSCDNMPVKYETSWRK